MLTMKDTGLVSGVGLSSTPLVPVKVLRGFFDEDRQARSPGEVLLVRERFARSLIATGKAERAELPINPEPAPEPTAPGVSANAPEEQQPADAPAESKPSRGRGRRFTEE